MGDFRSELLGELSSHRKGDVADAIGMPDQQDYETLLGIIAAYERKNPGYLAWHVSAARAAFIEGTYGKNIAWKGQAEVNKDSRMRLALDIPEGLGQAIEKVFPSMFRSKKHLRWFCQKFPGLTISGKAL
jgi:hypothetical protein